MQHILDQPDILELDMSSPYNRFKARKTSNVAGLSPDVMKYSTEPSKFNEIRRNQRSPTRDCFQLIPTANKHKDKWASEKVFENSPQKDG